MLKMTDTETHTNTILLFELTAPHVPCVQFQFQCRRALLVHLKTVQSISKILFRKVFS